ncbi:tetratricopeptide repeat protein [bacterium]|nr:tetratricopeptide repeat protein [bacterium]
MAFEFLGKSQKTETRDPYRDLGVGRNAKADEIKKAYFKLVRRYSPELFPEEFTRIRAAYDTLRDPAKRARADLTLFSPLEGEIGFSDCSAEKVSLIKLNQQIKELEQAAGAGVTSTELLRLYKQRSLALFMLGEEEKALAEWERLKKLAPGDAEVVGNIFRFYHKRGYDLAMENRFKEAVEYWKRAQQLEPKNTAILQNLAMALHRLHRDHEGLPYWQQCLSAWETQQRMRPADAYWKALVKETSRQLGEFRHVALAPSPAPAADTVPEKPKARYDNPNKQMGYACYSEGKYREAIAALERYLNQQPEDAEALDLLARSYLANGDRDKPFVIWNRLRRLVPDDSKVKQSIIDAHLGIARNLIEEQLFTPALVHLKKVQGIEPLHGESLVEIARIHFLRGDYRLAQSELERLLAREPRHRSAKKLLQDVRVRLVGH